MSGSPLSSYTQRDWNNIPHLNFVVEQRTSDASATTAGRVFIRTDLSKLRFADGSTIRELTISGLIADGDIASGAAIAESKLALASDAAAGTASRRTLGTGAQQALAGNTRLDQITAPTASVALNNQKITGLGTPSANTTDAATTAYVDTAVNTARTGIAGIKDPVRVAATTNVALSTGLVAGQVIDGVTLVTGDRVLLTNQSTTTQNGIYLAVASGTGTRALDADGTGEILDGTLVAVAEGTGAGKSYIQTATPSGAIGSWTQTWAILSTGGTVYSADETTLHLTGSTFSLLNAPIANGGTNASTAAGARTNLGVARKGAVLAVPALTAGVEATIAHGTATANAVAQVRKISDGSIVDIAIRTRDATNVFVTADIAVSSNTLELIYSPVD